jgi:ketosteroid isomerase-like protein
MPGSTTIAPPMPVQRGTTPFDLDGFFMAMRRRDADAWSDCFAPDAQWLVYRHHNPAVDPVHIEGNVAVHGYLREVCDSDAHLHVEDVVSGNSSVWFRRMVRLGNGRMVIEHVHLRIDGGLITREIDVASWDYA